MGGGKSGGHAMVVALHLYKLLKSSRKFTELMTKNFETTIKGVDCLIPFNDQLKVLVLHVCFPYESCMVILSDTSTDPKIFITITKFEVLHIIS